MKRILFTVLALLFLILSTVVYSKECSDYLKPIINLSENEDLVEETHFFREVAASAAYVNYALINSSLENFNFERKTGKIDFTPTSLDWGRHKLFFYAINKDDCYSAKLVNFNVYDKPKIMPLKPDAKIIRMYEGQGATFIVDVYDKDDDIKDYFWYVNDKKQEGISKGVFVFTTGYNFTGSYNITLVVVDAKKLNDSYQWEIVVQEKNRDPYLFSDINDFAAPKGMNVVTNRLDNYFGDADNDNLVYTVTASDSNGNNIDITSFIGPDNKLNINPKNFTGVLIIEITAKDAYGASVKSNKFKIYVSELGGTSKYYEKLTQECRDSICSGDETCDSCEKDCGPCRDGETKCVNDWKCQDWSACLPMGYSARECIDNNDCYDKTRTPIQLVSCELKDSCFDKIKNDNEKMVDCGGPCMPCPSCHDKIQNQGEMGIDCAGPCDVSCPKCDDKIQNQFESDIDCGGPCEECFDRFKCYSWRDCKSHICKNGFCAVATCIDNVKNQDEKGVDCEGVCGGRCPTCFDQIQNQNESGIDCAGPCAPCPACNDGVKNQAETYVDCGGECRKCTWKDFKSNNPSKAMIIYIAILLFILPFIVLITYEVSKHLIGKRKIDRLAFLNSIMRRKTKVFKGKKEIIEKTSSKIKNILKEIAESNKKNMREEVILILSEFLENLADIKSTNDKETIRSRLKEMRIKYPLSSIILFIAEETKEISANKYLSGLEIINKLEMVSVAISEIEKEA